MTNMCKEVYDPHVVHIACNVLNIFFNYELFFTFCRGRLESPKQGRKIPSNENSKNFYTLSSKKSQAETETSKNSDNFKRSSNQRSSSKTLQPPKQSYLKKTEQTSKIKESSLPQKHKEIPNGSIKPNSLNKDGSSISLQSSGIHKPTAAVKGTSKLPDKHNSKSPLMSPDVTKRNIRSPYIAHRSLSPSVLDSHSSQTLQKRILGPKEEGSSGVTVALVSPMPSRHASSLPKARMDSKGSLENLKNQTVESINGDLLNLQSTDVHHMRKEFKDINNEKVKDINKVSFLS